MWLTSRPKGIRGCTVLCLALTIVILVAGWGRLGAVGQARRSDGADESLETQSALISRYCVTCHSERLKTAGLELDSLDLSQVGQYADTWEKVVRKLPGRPDAPGGFATAQRDRLSGSLVPARDRAR